MAHSNTGKQSGAKFPIEYRLLITPIYHEREKRKATRVALRTVNEFTSFRYEIVVKPELTDRTIRLSIQGLRAPQLTLPEMGPALFATEYTGLHGNYTIIISKPSREENIFTVNISDTHVVLENSPAKRFVDLVTTEGEW